MDLRSSSFRDRMGALAALGIVAGLAVVGCERDNTVSYDRNRPPETFITEGPDNSDDVRDPVDLFYRAHLFWRGEDRDGTIAGFRFAIDDTNDPGAWTFTTQTDSTFRFQVAEVGSREHLFLIRAVDNLGKQDATPDTIRFEAFTTSSPSVGFVRSKMLLNGQPYAFTGRDTVQVFSGVTFVWSGTDADGEIVGWESKFDTEAEYRFHDRNDTTRTENALRAGAHTMFVRGIDDAGAKSSTLARFALQSNFDPRTTIDKNSITAVLSRPWVAPDDTLRVTFTESDFLDTVPDTIPSRSTLTFCWSTTDIDGPVIDWFWAFAGQGERVTTTCVTTDPLVASDGTTGGIALSVRGRDTYGQAEGFPELVDLMINFAPEVTFTNQFPGDVPIGPPFQFDFTSKDADSDPDSLLYQWRFATPAPGGEINGPFSLPVSLTGPSLFVQEAFTQSDIGPKVLELRAFETVGGSEFRAIPDTVFFTVVP